MTWCSLSNTDRVSPEKRSFYLLSFNVLVIRFRIIKYRKNAASQLKTD